MSAALPYILAPLDTIRPHLPPLPLPPLSPSICRADALHALLFPLLPSPSPLPAYPSAGHNRLLSSGPSSYPLSSLSALLPVFLASVAHTAAPASTALGGDESIVSTPSVAPLSAVVSSSLSPSPLPATPTSSPSSHPSSAPPASPTPLHTTEWSDVSLTRFCFWMGLFSVAENFLFYPFYLLKTREQTDRSSAYRPLDFAKHHVRQIIRKEGPKGLYRGFVASSLVSLPAYGVYSGSYTWAKELLGYHSQLSSPDPSALDPSSSSFAARHPVFISYAAPFLAGLVADVASIALYVPGDVIVQRLQVVNSPYASFSDACRRIWKHEGAAGFFRGFNATLFTSAIASAVWWLVYEQSKARLYRWDERRKSAAPQFDLEKKKTTGGLWAAMTEVNRTPQLMAGFIAGTITSSIINPLDVVKTRLQVQGSAVAAPSATSAGAAAPKPKPYRNFVHGLRSVYKEEGMRGYVRGLVPKLVSRGPLSAVSSLMYELVLYLSREDQGERARNEKARQSMEQLK